MKKFFFYFCLFLFCFIQNSWSDHFIINNIVINKPWIKSIQSGQKVTSGYLKIINNSKSDDVLLSIESNFAKNNQIHSMDIQNDVMKMKHLKSGLLIKKKSKISLTSGGFHLMFFDIKEELKNKKYLFIILNFKKNGSIEIPFQIKKNHTKGHKHLICLK